MYHATGVEDGIDRQGNAQKNKSKTKEDDRVDNRLSTSLCGACLVYLKVVGVA